MARVLPAAAINAIKGHVGAINFQSGSPTPFVAVKRSATASPTAAQRKAQAAWSAMVRTWASAVSPTQKAGWRSFADANPFTDSCGNSRKLTNFQAFARSAQNLKAVGHAALSTAPSSFTAGSPGDATLIYTAGSPPTLVLSITTPPTLTEAPLISISRPSRVGDPSAGTKTVNVLAPGTGSTGPWNLYSAYLAHFGNPIPGTQVTAHVSYIETTSGARGTTSSAAAVIT